MSALRAMLSSDPAPLRDALSRVLAITGKEFKQLRRDRITFGMVVGMPLMQVLMFGYAINMDVRHLRAVVVDQSRTQLAREWTQDLEATQVIDVVARVASVAEAEALLRRSAVVVGIVIPEDFAARVAQAEQPATSGSEHPPRAIAQLLVDGSDPTVEGVARQLALTPLPGRSARESAVAVRTYYNPERRSPVNIVPALIGVILTMTMVMFTAMAIVRERERGNLEYLITTPVSSGELMLGKILPYVVIGLIQVTLVAAIGKWVFAVPLVGTLLDLYLASLAFIIANLGLGLLISTAAQNQFQAMQLTIFTLLPSILLSGFMFPFDGMPIAAQWLAYLLPLTHFVQLVRGIVLKGATLLEMWQPLLALAAFFALTLTAATKRFHKRLD
jgi:ABC-2 type transport system permease protein